jgi:hypothetical protein
MIETIQQRKDALNIYTGRPQEYNTFGISEYRPSIEKNPNSIYYKINDSKLQRLLEDVDVLDAFEHPDFWLSKF